MCCKSGYLVIVELIVYFFRNKETLRRASQAEIYMEQSSLVVC